MNHVSTDGHDIIFHQRGFVKGLSIHKSLVINEHKVIRRHCAFFCDGLFGGHGFTNHLNLGINLVLGDFIHGLFQLKTLEINIGKLRVHFHSHIKNIGLTRYQLRGIQLGTTGQIKFVLFHNFSKGILNQTGGDIGMDIFGKFSLQNLAGRFSLSKSLNIHRFFQLFVGVIEFF